MLRKRKNKTKAVSYMGCNYGDLLCVDLLCGDLLCGGLLCGDLLCVAIMNA